MILVLVLIAAASTLATADRAFEAGDWYAAIRAYQAYLEEEPDSFDGYFGLARALAYSHRLPEAAKIYTVIIEMWPDNADIRLGRARVYAWMERFDEAEADLDVVTHTTPDYAEAWSAVGDVYLWSERSELAIEAYTRWAKLEPDHPEPYLARSRAYEQAGRFRQAEFDLDRAGGRGADEAWIDARRRLLREDRRAAVGDDWAVRTHYEYVGYADNRADWHTATTAIWRQLTFGSMAIESGVTRRFERLDALVAFDGYPRLWPHAYGHVRVQSSPTAEVLPRWDLKVELFQGLPGPVEVWSSYRHMRFADVRVHIPGLGAGIYLGDWWVGEETVVVPSRGEVGFAELAMVRYYYDTSDDLLELRLSGGREVVELGPGRTDTRRGFLASVRVQRFFTDHFGAELTTSMDRQEDTPTGWGAALGTAFRW